MLSGYTYGQDRVNQEFQKMSAVSLLQQSRELHQQTDKEGDIISHAVSRVSWRASYVVCQHCRQTVYQQNPQLVARILIPSKKGHATSLKESMGSARHVEGSDRGRHALCPGVNGEQKANTATTKRAVSLCSLRVARRSLGGFPVRAASTDSVESSTFPAYTARLRDATSQIAPTQLRV